MSTHDVQIQAFGSASALATGAPRSCGADLPYSVQLIASSRRSARIPLGGRTANDTDSEAMTPKRTRSRMTSSSNTTWTWPAVG
jgi:hypothetical protein